MRSHISKVKVLDSFHLRNRVWCSGPAVCAVNCCVFAVRQVTTLGVVDMGSFVCSEGPLVSCFGLVRARET